jgi:hypothetical protein
MITLTPTNEQKEKALAESAKMGSIRNSIRRGAGNAVGFLAEIMLADYLGCERTPCKDYDLTWNGITIDVKTKETTVPPKDYYDCSIAETSLHQQCDKYLFTRYIRQGDLYVLGWLDKDKYFEDARFLKKGEQDGDNGFIVRANCYNLRINQLEDLML